MVIKGMEIISGSGLGKEIFFFHILSVHFQGLLQQKWLPAEYNTQELPVIDYVLIFWD